MGKKKPYSVEEIIKNQWLVRFDRKPFDEITECGFVLDVNDEFTLINDYDDNAGVIGYTVFKNSTVRKYIVYNDQNSHEALTLKLKKIKPKEKPNISIDSVTELLKSISQSFPLIIVHREELRKDACWIGKLLTVKNKSFEMLEIDANAEWHEEPSRFKFKDITKIEFGSGYENNLAMVAEYRKGQT